MAKNSTQDAAPQAPSAGPILPRTPEMERHLQAGYPGLSVERAHAVIAERKAAPAVVPFAEAEKAKAFLEAYGATPRPVSTTPAWVRED